MAYKLHIFFLFFFCSRVTSAQNIEIGDRVPDFTLNVYNYKQSTISLSELRGKLTIIAFWSHICSTCIKSFPELDSLQRKYQDKVQIILVNAESVDSTYRFFKARKKIWKPNLPFVSGDTVLKKYFPHNGVPYDVWIDSAGVVRYMTYGHNTTSKNIDSFFTNVKLNVINFKKKKNISTLFDSTYLNKLEYYSYLTRCLADVDLFAGRSAGYDQVSVNCASISKLFIRAFDPANSMRFNSPGRLLLQVDNPQIYVTPRNMEEYDEWLEKYSYCYHLMVPQHLASRKFQIMQQQLMDFFNISAKIERVNVNCFALIKTDNNSGLVSKGGRPEVNFYKYDEQSEKRDSLRCFKNQPFSTFSMRFGGYIEHYFKKPFIDETGLSGNVDVCFSGAAIDSMNIAEIKASLNRYGLDIIIKEVPLDVLVLRTK